MDSVHGMHYEERGEGPPILCVHGTGTYGEPWWPSMEPLVATNRVITYDRLGFGASRSTGRLAASLADHAADSAALLTALETGPATIVGMSGGGPIVLGLAITRPELVSRVVLAEPAFQMAFTPSLSASRALAVAGFRLLRRDPEAAAVGFYRWTSAHMSGGNGFDPLPEAWKGVAIEHADAVFHEIPQLIRPWPRPRDVRRISCPVTIVFADDGQPVFRRTTRRLARLLPEARIAHVNGAGHLIPTDQAAAFSAIVAEAVHGL